MRDEHVFWLCTAVQVHVGPRLWVGAAVNLGQEVSEG